MTLEQIEIDIENIKVDHTKNSVSLSFGISDKRLNEINNILIDNLNEKNMISSEIVEFIMKQDSLTTVEKFVITFIISNIVKDYKNKIFLKFGN